MAVISDLRIQNSSGRELELALNPWHGWLDIPSGTSVRVIHGLPSWGWVEVDVSQSAIFYHGWDGFDCRVEIPNQPDVVLLGSSSVSTPDSARPRDKSDWAERLPESSQRLHVAAFDRPPLILAVDPHNEATFREHVQVSSEPGKGLRLVVEGDRIIVASDDRLTLGH